jgi:plasmid maintenance system antidote protein VapI
MTYTQTQVIAQLRRIIETAGGVSPAAHALGIGRVTIHNILSGRYQIGKDVARALGYRAVTRYERRARRRRR